MFRNVIVTLRTVPPSKPTGDSKSKAAAWSFPNCGSTAQPDVIGSASMAAATPRPVWSNVERGLTSFTSAGLPPVFGPAVTLRSVRQKLPLAARPGPFFTSDAWVNASIRNAVISLASACSTKVSVSIGGFVPETRTLPSSCLVSVAPPAERIEAISGTSQPLVAASFGRAFSQAANRGGSCSFSNFARASASGACSASKAALALR